MVLLKRIKIWASVLYSLFATFPSVKADIMSSADTADFLQQGKSLIRFGDGEFGIYRGKDIHYQAWSPALKAEFDEIKAKYEKDPLTCPYLLAVPKDFMTVSGLKLMKKRVYVSSWAESRLQFQKTFRRDIPYGDSFLFAKENFAIYSQLWKNEYAPQNVIFVHNQEKYAGKFAQTYGKNVRFVQCPAQNAYAEADTLEKTILQVIEQEKWTAEDVCITLSAGPAGKALVYRLSKLGYHCIDAGHSWDDPLEGM
ncbi:MAG: DUF1792 domain-containing protein [Oscillospiraceae bacterium]|nr:DUF1792 domain-containing protein [Oscillospiraceae bacterium]